jgi:Fe-S-cluster-containing dehydrogenase component
VPAAGDDFRAWLMRRWQAAPAPSGAPADAAWREALRAGGAWREPAPVSVRLQAEAEAQVARWHRVAAAARAAADGLHLWLWPSVMLFDGRGANRGWLQETPDPTSSLVWGSWVDMHPDDAARLGVREGARVQLRTAAGACAAPVRVTPDVAAGVVALAFGQGHAALGRQAAGVGANAFALRARPVAGDGFGTVGVTPAGGRGPLLSVAPTQAQFGREIVQWVPLSGLKDGTAGQGARVSLPLPEDYRPDADVYRPHDHPRHRWGMAIDLQRCTGCGACAVACQAENNVPVVGREQVARGREMAWLKVVPYRAEDNPRRLGWLPLLCQQCDAAPCEPVCPVFAAVHSDEGLNAQVYNRCIGTRYCSNNCPYKVRRFNWFDITWEAPLDLQLNPEVTVRCRGVMEKCTFCVQRIRRVQLRAASEGRAPRDGEIQPACVQSCPARALVFGDLKDPDAAVTRLTRADPRRYHVLEELNARPAVVYLRRIASDA